MALAAEVETGDSFVNTRMGEKLQPALEEIGHLQLAVPVMTDNLMMCGIVNKTVKQRRTCVINMQFDWVRGYCAQGHFIIYWVSETENMGDYLTKHHTGLYHRRILHQYLPEPRYLTQSVKIIDPTSL
eukprot:10615583-Ditylum_brightwellii.AAC.1